MIDLLVASCLDDLTRLQLAMLLQSAKLNRIRFSPSWL
jgi:hypothetical protein